MNIRCWIVQGTLSTVIGWGLFAYPAWAQTNQIAFILPSYANQTFECIMQQAASLARASIAREFAENPDLTEVSVTILGQHNGQTVPVLLAKVSRSDWQKKPIIAKWIRYFSSSEVLLGFKQPQAPQSFPQTSQTLSRTESNWIGDGRGFDDEDD